MNNMLFAAPSSNSGKTTVVCAVLAALKKRNLSVHAFKCGPDYIDPMFHRAVLGVPCHNLDLYLSGEERVKELYARYSAGADVSVVEGVMGFYDGVGRTEQASAWHVSELLDLPVILIARPEETPEETLAVIRGLQTARENHIRALLLNECTAEQYAALKPMLEAKTGLPVPGYLPHVNGAEVSSRHLGLQQAEEIKDLSTKIDLLASAAEEHIALEELLGLTGAPNTEAPGTTRPETAVRLAVAQDEAFRFCYEESLDAFRDAGAEPVFFSPLRSEHLPENISGLYLPGGYPELYAKELSENESLKEEIRSMIAAGLPTIAECGGYLYLSQTLETPEGDVFPLVGAIPGDGVKTEKLVRFGYAELVSKQDTLLAPAGTPIRTHNFHHWEQTDRGDRYHAVKPVSGVTYDTGYGTESLYAAFPHLYFAGNRALTERIVKTMEDQKWRTLAQQKWNACAKPLGSLGVLEDMVTDICALTHTLTPSIEKKAVAVFCADNGVVAEGITQTGQEVTRLVSEQMKLGKSSINNFARVAGADVFVYDAGMAPNGTANLLYEPAMTKEQLDAALELGRKAAHDLADRGYGLLAAGEMGIGNTTTSSALVSVLLGADVELVTGRGAGLTSEALARKVEVIKEAIARHNVDPEDTYEVLRTFGGLDIAAMCGLYIGAAEARVPVLVDGFPSSVAALCAVRLNADAKKAILMSHVSAEPAGQMVVKAIGKDAPISAGLRLGEGTGAVAAMPLLEMAFEEFNEGYTFDEGGIEQYEELT